MSLDRDAQRAAGDLHRSVDAIDIPDFDGLVRRDRRRRARNAGVAGALAVVLVIGLVASNWPSSPDRRRVTTATAPATPEQIQNGWHHLSGSEIGFSDKRIVTTATGWKGGYALAGSIGDTVTPAVWTSADGRHFDVHQLATTEGTVSLVMRRGDDLVAFGQVGTDRVVWSSTDGSTWNTIARGADVLPGEAITDGSSDTVRAGGAVGNRVVVQAGRELDGQLFASTDLKTWSRITGPNTPATAVNVVVGEGRAYVTDTPVGSNPTKETILRTSVDGVTWPQVDRSAFASNSPFAADASMLLRLAQTSNDTRWQVDRAKLSEDASHLTWGPVAGPQGLDTAVSPTVVRTSDYWAIAASTGEATNVWISRDLTDWTGLPESLAVNGMVPAAVATNGNGLLVVDESATDLLLWTGPSDQPDGGATSTTASKSNQCEAIGPVIVSLKATVDAMEPATPGGQRPSTAYGKSVDLDFGNRAYTLSQAAARTPDAEAAALHQLAADVYSYDASLHPAISAGTDAEIITPLRDDLAAVEHTYCPNPSATPTPTTADPAIAGAKTVAGDDFGCATSAVVYDRIAAAVSTLQGTAPDNRAAIESARATLSRAAFDLEHLGGGAGQSSAHRIHAAAIEHYLAGIGKWQAGESRPDASPVTDARKNDTWCPPASTPLPATTSAPAATTTSAAAPTLSAAELANRCDTIGPIVAEIKRARDELEPKQLGALRSASLAISRVDQDASSLRYQALRLAQLASSTSSGEAAVLHRIASHTYLYLSSLYPWSLNANSTIVSNLNDDLANRLSSFCKTAFAAPPGPPTSIRQAPTVMSDAVDRPALRNCPIVTAQMRNLSSTAATLGSAADGGADAARAVAGTAYELTFAGSSSPEIRRELNAAFQAEQALEDYYRDGASSTQWSALLASTVDYANTTDWCGPTG